MIFQRHYLACLSHASYLVADETTRVAAVVDPQRDVGRYLDEAKARGLKIAHVVLTHFHADFVSGHLELARATGADVRLGANGSADYPHVPVRDGDVLDLGPGTRLKFLATPGHTPESICVLVIDRARGDDVPVSILTGDTLFIGDVGRPDLAVTQGASAKDLAGVLYDSLTTKILPLPDETLVYPAHGAGSLCGKNLGAEPCGALGRERRTNPALAATSRDEFVRRVTADLSDAPAYFAFDADLNRREHDVLDAVVARDARPLALGDVLSLVERGATLLDVRTPDEFAAGHLAGSVNVALGGRYAQWCGAVLDRSHPIVVIAPAGKEREAILRLGRIGLDGVAGFLPDVLVHLRARPDLVRHVPRTTAPALARSIAERRAPVVVDVRAPGEWDAGHVAGALHLPLSHPERLRDVPRDRPVVVHCQSGYRSSIAVSLLLREGHSNVSDLVGGWGALEATGAAGA